jgi:hypothetical protein
LVEGLTISKQRQTPQRDMSKGDSTFETLPTLHKLLQRYTYPVCSCRPDLYLDQTKTISRAFIVHAATGTRIELDTCK